MGIFEGQFSKGSRYMPLLLLSDGCCARAATKLYLESADPESTCKWAPLSSSVVAAVT